MVFYNTLGSTLLEVYQNKCRNAEKRKSVSGGHRSFIKHIKLIYQSVSSYDPCFKITVIIKKAYFAKINWLKLI